MKFSKDIIVRLVDVIPWLLCVGYSFMCSWIISDSRGMAYASQMFSLGIGLSTLLYAARSYVYEHRRRQEIERTNSIKKSEEE